MGSNEEQGDNLFEVCLCGIDVSKKVGAACGKFPRDIWVFIELVEQALSNAISFHPRNYQAKTFLGTIEVFEKTTDIYYDRNQNTCWRRFIVTKEMCHLLFAPFGEKHLASTPEEVEQLINKILAGLENVEFDHKISTELATVYMAIEVLLPNSEREIVNRMLAVGTPEIEVARKYMLPVQMLKIYLNPRYAEKMKQAYEAAGD